MSLQHSALGQQLRSTGRRDQPNRSVRAFPYSHQRKKKLSSSTGEFPGALANGLVPWVLATDGAERARVRQLTVPEGLTAGRAKCRAGKDGDIRGAVQVPATRVFSLHVVQAGSARAAGGGRACPTAFNRAGEKLRATGGELPRVWAEADPQREGGLALPLSSERKVKGTRNGAGG